MDDDPGVAVRVPGDVAEEGEQVVDERQQVGEDDVVERVAEVDVLAGADFEPELRMPRSRELDHAGADVDADSDSRCERCEQIAGAAPDLEHRGIRRHDRLVDRRNQVVVAARTPAPASLLRRELVERLRDDGVRVARGDRRSASLGCGRLHAGAPIVAPPMRPILRATVPCRASRHSPRRLAEQEAVWRRRPLLRRLYNDWFDLIVERLSQVEGPTIELGSGFAPLKERLPILVATDVEPTPWADVVVDAHALPYPDGSLANIVAVDVLHHLADQQRFLDEVRRTLRPGGRLVAVEPYAGPLSTLAYRLFHHEQTDPQVDPFYPDSRLAAASMEGNQALPTIVFFRRVEEFRTRWPELRIVERQRFAPLLYPLSGGFSRRPLVPGALYRPLRIWRPRWRLRPHCSRPAASSCSSATRARPATAP